MKHKRIIAILLCVALLIPMLPTVFAPEVAAADEGAFGIETPSYLSSDEERKQAENTPFGSKEGDPFPLFVKSELFVSYGWDGNKDAGANYVKSFDATGSSSSGVPSISISSGTNQTGSKTVFSGKGTMMASALDGLNVGGGKDEYVAMLGLDAATSSNASLYLYVMDKNGNRISTKHIVDRSWLDSVEAYQVNGFLAVACGDFDNNGVDSIIVYSPGAGGDTEKETAQLLEYSVNSNGTIGSSTTVNGNLLSTMGGSDYTKLDKQEAKNAPKVQLVAADTDKDGYEELVVTVSMNDTNGGDKFKWLGTQVFIYDKLDSGWTKTREFSLEANSSGRMVWGTSSVGNVIVTDDTGGQTDFPEIVTAGMLDGEKDNLHNINVDGSDQIRYTIIRCSGIQGSDEGQKNYQGTYEKVTDKTMDSNGFTKGGFYESEDVNALLQVKCFSYQGAAAADAVFISGTVYTCDQSSGALSAVYTPQYFTDHDNAAGSYTLTNAQVESVAAGNFDGNDEGREQIVCVTLLKQSGANNIYSRMYLIGNESGSGSDGWSDKEDSSYFVNRKGRGYVAVTDFDYDKDSTIVKYEGVEKQWSNPEVMAILEPSPFFHDIGIQGNSATDYGVDKSSGHSTESSQTLSTNILIGFEWTDPTNTGGGFESTIENNFTWSTNESRTITYSVNYSNTTEETQVVVYRTPSLVYMYTDVNTGEKIYLAKALQPVTKMISADEYNAEAPNYNMETIDESRFCIPGDPSSYHSTTGSITASGGQDVMDSGNGFSSYDSNGAISKGISVEEMKEKSFTYEFAFSFTAYGMVFGAKAGGGAGYGYENTSTEINGTTINRGGTVEGVQQPGYNFSWDFACWSTELNGLTIPVCGYLVKDVVAPPSPAKNLNITNITSSSLTLQWEAGLRPAEKYNIYRVLEDTTDPYLYVGSVSGEGQEFSFDMSGLRPDTSYTFVVRGAKDDKESVDGISATARTSIDTGATITINPLTDQSVAPGGSVTFSTSVYRSGGFTSLNLNWQTRAAGSGNWTDIDGATGESLKLTDVTASMNGSQYRLKVQAATTTAERSYYYSNTATLTVGTTGTSSILSVTGWSSGAGTLDTPYTGNATYSTKTPQTEYQTVWTRSTFTAGSVTGLVYEAGGTYTKVTKDASGQDITTTVDTGLPLAYIGETAAGYYSLMKNEATGAYTARSVLTVNEKCYAGDGTEYTLPGSITASSPACKAANDYIAVLAWDRTAVTPTVLWYDAASRTYYTYDAGEGSYTAASVDGYSYLDEILYMADVVSDSTDAGGAPVPGTDGKIVARGSDIYVLTTSASDASVTLDTVSPDEYVEIDGNKYSLSALREVSATSQQPVITYTETTVTGTGLNLSAMLYANSTPLADTGADFVITDQTTGASTVIHAVSNASGEISGTWTASTPGLYAIQVSIPATATLRASLSAAQYYYAYGNPEDLYRLRTVVDGSDVVGSISYGSTIKLVPEKWDEDDKKWVDLTGSFSIDCTMQGSDTTTTLTANSGGYSYTPTKAGKYTFSLKRSGTLLTAAVLTVNPISITVTPTWPIDTIPTQASDVTLRITRTDDLTSEIPDKDKLLGALNISCDYFSNTSATGVFSVDLSWNTEEKAEDIAYLNGAYSITLISDSFYKKPETAPVTYEVVNNLGGTIEANSGEKYIDFASNVPQDQGTKLRFQATPDAGYRVARWKINGTDISQLTNSRYSVASIDGDKGIEQLTIESFDITADATINGALLVQVEFTNQTSTIHYSATGNGTLTAKTSAGTNVASGATLAYGATVTFTAAPANGYMVSAWKISTNDGEAKTYTWPGTDAPYRETTLTLSDLDQSSYTISVEFVEKQSVTVMAPTMVDGDGNIVNAGTIAMTDVNNGAITANTILPVGQAVTYTVNFTDDNYNTVNVWEYSTNGTDWTSVPNSSRLSYTHCSSSDGSLYVRAVVSVAQAYTLSWNVTGLESGDESKANLTAKSGNASLNNGSSYAVNTPVTFTLELDDSYYVVGWSDNVTSAEDSKSATLTLTDTTTVTVTVAKKPTVSWTDPTGGTISVKGTVNGEANTTIQNGGYVDPNTTITVTANPNSGYVVDTINNTAVNTGRENGSKAQDVTIGTDDVTVTASFSKKPVVTISNDQDNGTVEVKGTVNGQAGTPVSNGGYVDFGTDLTVTLKPDTGYEVTNFTVDSSSVTTAEVENSDNRTYTGTVPDAGTTIGVTFSAIPTAVVTYSVVDKNSTEAGGLDGTITAEVTRKGMNDYAKTYPEAGTATEISAAVYRDSTVTFTATPEEGYRVKEWTVNGDVQKNSGVINISKTLTLEIPGDVTDKDAFVVTVEFMPVGSQVTAFAGDNGSIISAVVGDSEQVENIGIGFTLSENASVVFTAQPDVGYEVDCWLVNGEDQPNSSSNTFTYTAQSNDAGAVITVTFRQVEYTVTWGGTNGTVSVDNLTSGASIRGGTAVTFTAKPDEGYILSGWTVNGETVPEATNTTFTWTVPNGKTAAPAVSSYAIKAIFERGKYAVTVTQPEHGAITPKTENLTAVTGGTSVTFTATPANGYILTGWTVNGETTDTRSTTRTVTITKATTVTAVLVPSHYEVTCVASETAGGTVTVSGSDATSASVAYGGSVTFTAAPAEYYHVSGWKVDNEEVANTANQNTFTLTNVTETHTVTAVFEAAIRYDVYCEVDTTGGGTISATANGTPLVMTSSSPQAVWGGSKLVFTATPGAGNMVAQWTVNDTLVTRDNMESLGVTLDHYLANTLTVESLSKAMNIRVSFTELKVFKIPGDGPGYTVTVDTRNPEIPADYDTHIRENGDVKFTIKPAMNDNEYVSISKFEINGYDCIAGKLMEDRVAPDNCLSVAAVRNADGSYTVTITGVTDTISADIVAHKVVVSSLSVPAAFEGIEELDSVDEIQAKLVTKLTGTSETQVFYDIALKYWDGDKWVNVTTENFPANGVDVVLPYPDGTDSKDTFTIVHMLTTKDNEGKLEIITPEKKSDGLHFHVTSLSPFGVSWIKYTAPSGGGGGSIEPEETVILTPAENGTLTASDKYAAEGDTLTITAKPDEGYELESLTATDKDGKALTLTDNGDGTFTLTMPAEMPITITAVFAAEEPCDGIHDCPSTAFQDLDTSAWYHLDTDYVITQGLMNGTSKTTFEPESTLDRAMVVTILYRLEGEPEVGSNVFTDVEAGQWYTNAVIWAAENGVVEGYGDNLFGPEDPITREQIATILYRYAKYKGYNVTAREDISTFTDGADTSDWAKTAMSWAKAVGLVNGKENNMLDPLGNATRAEAAALFHRFCENIIK